jgi:hypothetical protein
MGKPPKEPVVAESPEAKRFLSGMRALLKVPKAEILGKVTRSESRRQKLKGVRRGNIGTTGRHNDLD